MWTMLIETLENLVSFLDTFLNAEFCAESTVNSPFKSNERRIIAFATGIDFSYANSGI